MNSLIRTNVYGKFLRTNYELNIIKRQLNVSSYFYNKVNHKPKNENKIEQLIEKYKDTLYFNSYLDYHQLRYGHKQNSIFLDRISKHEEKWDIKNRTIQPLPISLRYLNEKYSKKEETEKEPDKDELPTHFPFQSNGTVVTNESFKDSINIDENDLDVEVKTRLELLNKSNEHLNWMKDYENYEKDLVEEEDQDALKDTHINYGTPDPSSQISKVPCGGCGALLHCKDTAIPGYIPSEIFNNYNKQGGTPLKAITCQRCHFLKNYDLALQVRVSPDDYPKVLTAISNRERALVVLMVDLLDFPCSIWPGIADFLGPGHPIVVVGNKVDLLPQDNKGYLERIAENLGNSVRESGFGMKNIKHVALISARTGYGVEDLITKLQNIWQYKGDVFLVGCTNVGKSSLFNALLQSDYCKSQASDLIQRATTSPWPGTTLNLLKFPILRPTGWRLHVRTQRIIATNKLESEQRKLLKEQFRMSRNPKYATLIGHIDKTFLSQEPVEEGSDLFSVQGNSNSKGIAKIGINEKDEEYALSKWCFDTPGVIQPDQLIHLLTTEEIVKTFPKQMIKPQTYSLSPGSTIFIAGLARLDYVEGLSHARFTVFASSNLPITICKISEADRLYSDFLGTELFSVPSGNPERLKVWPGLEPSNNIKLTGIDKEMSCADIVLSSAGWVAVTPDCAHSCTVQAWTPGQRGIYVRDSLLAKAVTLRGKKIRHSCAYKSNKYYLK